MSFLFQANPCWQLCLMQDCEIHVVWSDKQVDRQVDRQMDGFSALYVYTVDIQAGLHQ